MHLENMQKFWKWLWGIKMSRKFVYFQWLLIQRAIPVNAWQKGLNIDNMCSFCTNLVETAKHCLWRCDFVIEIWKRIVTSLIPLYPRAVYIWGTVYGHVVDVLSMRHGLM